MTNSQTHTVTAKTDWITIDLNKPLPWWLQPWTEPLPIEARVMVHDERRKARRKAEKAARKRRRK